MRSSSFTVIAACAALSACNKKPEGAKQAEGERPVASASNAPKKPVPTSALPPLAADPGGATGKAIWQAGFGGLGIDAPRAVAVAASGDVYVAGYFEGEIDFGGAIGKRTSKGKSDAYVAKLSADGKLVWAHTFGDAREDTANGIAVRGDRIVVTGNFLDKLELPGFTKKSNGSDDLFIAAFDKDGTPEWLWTAGGHDSDGANAIAATPDGGWVIGGSFTDWIGFSLASGTANFKSKGGTDALLIKLAPSGDTEWVKQFGGRYNDTILHVATDANGNIYVQGHFADVADFGGTPLKAGGGSDNDVVLAKYDTNGDHVWSQRFGNAFNDVAGGLAVDPAGNVTMVGSFDRSISFGEGDDHTSLGESDAFIARFTPDGKLAWARTYGADREDVAWGVAADAAGNTVTTGWFHNTVDFGKGVIASKGNKDVFALKLDAQGAPVWVHTWGGKDHDQGRAVALDDAGNAVVAGLYRFKLDLLDPPVQQALADDPVLRKAPKPDTFVVKLAR
jgi:hypothetical protein